MAAQIDVELAGSIESLLDRLKSKFTFYKIKQTKKTDLKLLIPISSQKIQLKAGKTDFKVVLF